MNTLFALLFLILIAWYWSDSTRAKESAIKTANRLCSQTNVQFLDQTVTLAKLKLARNPHGRIVLQRIYRFEFCITGSERYTGYITLLGQSIKQLELDHPDGKILSQY